jgi:YidC/Oxa1 family membrane protein insertase
MLELLKVVFYDPIYNALIAIVALLPSADIGLAVIILTALVKLVLFPLSRVAFRTQMAVKEMEPKLKEIQKKYKDKHEELARRTMALYKEKGINPFASIALLLIQLPIVISLYLVFFNEAKTFTVDLAVLYPFTPVPEAINTMFLGFMDVAAKSIPLAVIVAATQYWQTKLTLPEHVPSAPSADGPSLKDELARTFQMQMRYVFPVVIGAVAYFIGTAVALYFIASNLFSVGQEYAIRRERKKESAAAPGAPQTT